MFLCSQTIFEERDEDFFCELGQVNLSCSAYLASAYQDFWCNRIHIGTRSLASITSSRQQTRNISGVSVAMRKGRGRSFFS